MDKRVQGSAAIIFSTDAVRSRERTAFWTDVVCKQLIQADVSSIDARSVTDRHNRATSDRHIGASLNRL